MNFCRFVILLKKAGFAPHVEENRKTYIVKEENPINCKSESMLRKSNYLHNLHCVVYHAKYFLYDSKDTQHPLRLEMRWDGNYHLCSFCFRFYVYFYEEQENLFSDLFRSFHSELLQECRTWRRRKEDRKQRRLEQCYYTKKAYSLL